jgi:dTDP-4-dehydrorhamnose 3,5-epimerase
MTITYLVDGYYNPADELGVAWDDPEIDADWGVDRPDPVGARPGEPLRADLPATGGPTVAAHLICATPAPDQRRPP